MITSRGVRVIKKDKDGVVIEVAYPLVIKEALKKKNISVGVVAGGYLKIHIANIKEATAVVKTVVNEVADRALAEALKEQGVA